MKKKLEAVKLKRCDERGTLTNVADGRSEAAREPGQRSVLLAIESVLTRLESLREGKTTDEPFTEFEQLLVSMVQTGADGLERITGESLLPSHP